MEGARSDGSGFGVSCSQIPKIRSFEIRNAVCCIIIGCRRVGITHNGKMVDSTPARKTNTADSKGRLGLGARFANKMFRITMQPDGNILLEPVVAVHEREVWFFRNPEAQAQVQEGIRQSRAGETVYLGSFAQYADIDTDDDED